MPLSPTTLRVPDDCFHRRYELVFLALFYLCNPLVRDQVQFLQQDNGWGMPLTIWFPFEAPSKKPYYGNAMIWGPTDKVEGVY